MSNRHDNMSNVYRISIYRELIDYIAKRKTLGTNALNEGAVG